MKRNLTNLNSDHYEAMEHWIDIKKIDATFQCPWVWWKGCSAGNKFCKDIFPRLSLRLRKDGDNYKCPCSAYSYKYVRRVIRGILKDREDAS